jgi:hypothetical protein
MKLFVPLFVVALLALVACAVSSAEEELGPYKLVTTISIPGNLAGAFDISWVDSASERYYLSERTTVNGGGRIDVIDAEHNGRLPANGANQMFECGCAKS